jgi:hypothetical protein
MTTSRNARDEDAFAIKPVVFLMTVEVALLPVAGVNGKPKVDAPSAESDEAPIAPVGVTVTMLFVALPMPETLSTEVEANVPIEMTDVVAFVFIKSVDVARTELRNAIEDDAVEISPAVFIPMVDVVNPIEVGVKGYAKLA